MARKKKKKTDPGAVPSAIRFPPLVVHNPDNDRGPMIENRDPAPDDRMLRYRRNPACPECRAHPVICMMRRRHMAYYRCRQCGHRWEVEV